jgi:hypothetical protein
VGLFLAAAPLLVPATQPPGERSAALARLRPYLWMVATVTAMLASIVGARAALGLRPLGFGVHELGLKVAAVRDPGSAPGAVIENVRRTAEYAWLYLTPAGTLLLVGGVLGAWIGRHRLLRVLTGVATVYILVFVAAARNLSAHYLLPALPLYVPAMAWALTAGTAAVVRRAEASGADLRAAGGRALSTLLAGALLLAVAPSSLAMARALWRDPPRAPVARTERVQYLEGHWSGYGLVEVARWIEGEHARSGDGVVFAALHVADYERLRRYTSAAAQPSVVQVQVDRYTLPWTAQAVRLRALAASGRRVHVVGGSRRRFHARRREDFPEARLVMEFAKPGATDAAQVWTLDSRADPPSAR